MVTPLRGASSAPGPGRGGTQEDLRRHNLSAVLSHLHLSGPLSRAELTSRLQLNRSTIAGLVGELAAAHLIRERASDRPPSGVGRPSLLVEADPGRVQVIAAVVGVDRIDVALVGLGGTVVAKKTHTLGRHRSAADVAETLMAQAMTLAGSAGERAAVLGLGVAVPGVVRQSDGHVRFAPNLGWVDAPFGDLLRVHLGGPHLGGRRLHIGNDADLGLIGEHRRGAARGEDDVVFIAGDSGVGGGVVVGGRPLTGAGGYAGELGHILVRSTGRRCRCGARGCWETEIGAPAVARALGLPARTELADLDAALSLLHPGDPALAEVGRYLGLGMATIVNVLNPRVLIVGGLLRKVYPLVAAEASAALAEAALVAPAEQLQVRVPALGGDAALIGASELVWDDVLADPLAAARGAAPLSQFAEVRRRA